MIVCPVWMRRVATPVPSTAGMPYSRATMEPWLSGPPTSVTTADGHGEERRPGRGGDGGNQDLAGLHLAEVLRAVQHAGRAGDLPGTGASPSDRVAVLAFCTRADKLRCRCP